MKITSFLIKTCTPEIYNLMDHRYVQNCKCNTLPGNPSISVLGSVHDVGRRHKTKQFSQEIENKVRIKPFFTKADIIGSLARNWPG